MADRTRPKGGRTYLDVPFREKDAAHELGAKFDRRSKKWYVPGGADVAPFARWMPAHAPQAAPGAQGVPGAVREQPPRLFGSEADIEREAVRLSELMRQPLDESRAFVRESVQAAAEKAGLEARDRLRAQGASAFDMVDGVRQAGLQARHQYFADRQHLHAPGVAQASASGARAGQQPARPKLDDAALGRRYREMIQSIATASTLRGTEVNHTLALEQRLESIHRDAWRKSGNAADGERAIGEQIRTRTGFAAQALPPQAGEALNRLREEAGLSPIEIDERTPARDVTDSEPVGEVPPVDEASIAPLHPHPHREPERDEDFATFADIAEAFEPVPPTVKAEGDAVTFADVGEAAVIDDAMRRRGLTESAVTGNQGVAPSAVTGSVANEPVAQPGNAANDASTNPPPVSGVLDTQIQRTQTPAQNAPDAKNPANEPVRPEFDSVSTQDLERLRAVRDGERAAAEKLLREQGKPMPKRDGGTAGTTADAPLAGEARNADTSDNQIGIDPASRRPVVTKDGYDVPAHVASRYMVKDGRFWKLDGMEARPGAQPHAAPATQPHFEDVGARLNSRQNDRATIADMVAVARAKNWDSIVVRGSETFRRNAWIEASLAGVEVKGFTPAESDEALLEAAKRERAALTIRAGTSPEPAVAQKGNPATASPAAAPESPKPEATAVAAPTAAPAAEPPRTVAQLREVLEKSLERAPARMRAEVIRRFDARIQAGTEIEARIARGELGRDAGAAEIDRRAAELHAAWTAPKAAPAAGPSNNPQPAQAQTGGPGPKVV
jgi:hypothetical protein